MIGSHASHGIVSTVFRPSIMLYRYRYRFRFVYFVKYVREEGRYVLSGIKHLKGLADSP